MRKCSVLKFMFKVINTIIVPYWEKYIHCNARVDSRYVTQAVLEFSPIASSKVRGSFAPQEKFENSRTGGNEIHCHQSCVLSCIDFKSVNGLLGSNIIKV